MHNTKSHGKRLSPWNILQLMLTTLNCCPRDVSSVFQFFIPLRRNCLTLAATPIIIVSRHSPIQLCGKAMARFWCLLLQSLRIALSISNNWSLVPLLFLRHPFCSSGRIPSNCLYITSAMTPVMSIHMRGRQEMCLKLSTAFCLLWSFKQRIVLAKV